MSGTVPDLEQVISIERRSQVGNRSFGSVAGLGRDKNGLAASFTMGQHFNAIARARVYNPL